MTRYRVEFVPDAIAQVEAINAWWRENGPAAPDLFETELHSVVELLSQMPEAGTVYDLAPTPGVRRIVTGRSRYHVYWEISWRKRLVQIISVWHGARGSGPKL